MVTSGVKQDPDLHAMASIDAHSLAVLVSNYHDSGKAAAATPVSLVIGGVPAGRMRLQHYRVDDTHSNSFEAWKRMGSSAKPNPEQYAELEAAGQLQMVDRLAGSVHNRVKCGYLSACRAMAFR